jgi:hypothetical protein
MNRSSGCGRSRSPLGGPRGAVVLCASLLLAAGCGSGPEAKPQNRAAEAEWAWLQRTKGDLDARRARLAGSRADPVLAKQTQALAEELDRRLVELLNADPPVQGEPLSGRQQAALRMKSDEDIELARTYIDRGGDYQRALDIYQEDLAVDPGNSHLRAALAAAQGRRYITRAAFSQVQKGMDQDAVRRLLGAPNLNNVRAYTGSPGESGQPGKGIVGWFYPKDASGAAAAVWFHREDGRVTVYLADFNALQPPPSPSPAPPAKPRAPQRAT